MEPTPEAKKAVELINKCFRKSLGEWTVDVVSQALRNRPGVYLFDGPATVFIGLSKMMPPLARSIASDIEAIDKTRKQRSKSEHKMRHDIERFIDVISEICMQTKVGCIDVMRLQAFVRNIHTLDEVLASKSCARIKGQPEQIRFEAKLDLIKTLGLSYDPKAIDKTCKHAKLLTAQTNDLHEATKLLKEFAQLYADVASFEETSITEAAFEGFKQAIKAAGSATARGGAKGRRTALQGVAA